MATACAGKPDAAIDGPLKLIMTISFMPEVSFVRYCLARWLKNPGKKVWGAAEVLLGYLLMPISGYICDYFQEFKKADPAHTGDPQDA